VTRIEKLLETVTERAGPEGDVPINLFRLLLHPTSFPQVCHAGLQPSDQLTPGGPAILTHVLCFAQTVENFFDLSFLVKDGRVAMQADAGGAYVVLSKPPLADAYHKGLLKTQNILKLDYATYRKLVARWCGEGAPYLWRADTEFGLEFVEFGLHRRGLLKSSELNSLRSCSCGPPSKKEGKKRYISTFLFLFAR